MSGKMIETGRTLISISSFVGDAPRIWNKAPVQVTIAKSLKIAKKREKKVLSDIANLEFDKRNIIYMHLPFFSHLKK